MGDEEIRKAAYCKWEAEGRPDGQHERHWSEAQQEIDGKPTGVAQTWPPDDAGGVFPTEGERSTSEAIPSNEPDGFKPGELASENK